LSLGSASADGLLDASAPPGAVGGLSVGGFEALLAGGAAGLSPSSSPPGGSK